MECQIHGVSYTDDSHCHICVAGEMIRGESCDELEQDLATMEKSYEDLMEYAMDLKETIEYISKAVSGYRGYNKRQGEIKAKSISHRAIPARPVLLTAADYPHSS